LLGVSMALAVGCGGSGGDGPAAVPAAGTVTYQGQPVETGTIQFVPANGRAASGAIENGKFTLSTNGNDDGAIPGTHQVSVSAIKQGTKIVNGEPEVIHLVPEKYASPGMSGVTAEVPAAGSTSIEIKLD
jgi:hypothetical protein